MAATKVGIAVTCSTCGKRKSPHGRSSPDLDAYCRSLFTEDSQYCDGYWKDPMPGCLWPGETDEEFGYPCCSHATKALA